MFTDEYVWVREGETIVIPGTKGEYYVGNEQFLFEVHNPEDERFMDAIEQEAKFDGYTLSQSGYQQNEFSNMTFTIQETNDEDATEIAFYGV